jgi:hypothetical protein
MTTLASIVTEFFKQDEWPFVTMEEGTAYKVDFRGDNGQWVCYAQIWEEQRRVAFYSICPLKVPSTKLLTVAEFVTRANYGLIVGNFELDFNDGEVRYKTSIDIEGSELTPVTFQQIVYANVLTMDHYLPSLMSVIYSEVAPSEAIAQSEQ